MSGFEGRDARQTAAARLDPVASDSSDRVQVTAAVDVRAFPLRALETSATKFGVASKTRTETLHKGLPISAFATPARFRAWLSRNHETSQGLWVKIAKKGTGIDSITYEEARDVSICFGWIDGLKNAMDERYYAIRFTPRRKQSPWSQINRKIAEQLIEAGEMAPAGLNQVAAAKKDGRWQAAYAGSAKMEMHPDLAQAFKANPIARKNFDLASKANRYSVLYRVHEAKRPETRARRIEQFISMLARGDVPHPGK